jgi:hypothetical protein
MTGQWLADLVRNASVDLQRTQCADAAMRRASAVGVNIDGLDTGEHERRRTACLNAALLRFVQPDAPTATVRYGRGVKRQAPVVQEFMHYLAGGDQWSALLCGPGRTCKRRAGGARGLLPATRGDCMGGQLNLKPTGNNQ